jgi:hypothetical protein
MDVSEKSRLSLVASDHGASEASTKSTTNLYSPITKVTFSTILAELSQVAQRSLKFCKSSFDANVEKGDCVIDYMRYGESFECQC